MDPSARHVASPWLSAVWSLPALGLVLGLSGGLLVGVGMREAAPPAIAAHQAWVRPAAGVGTTHLTRPLVLPRNGGPQSGVGKSRGLRNANLGGRGWSGAASGCLRMECGLVLCAESPQVVTNRLPVDLRQALAMLAIAQHGGPWTVARPHPVIELACHRPSAANSDDRMANALFGPHERDARDAVVPTITANDGAALRHEDAIRTGFKTLPRGVQRQRAARCGRQNWCDDRPTRSPQWNTRGASCSGALAGADTSALACSDLEPPGTSAHRWELLSFCLRPLRLGCGASCYRLSLQPPLGRWCRG